MSQLKYTAYEGFGEYVRQHLGYNQTVRVGDRIEVSGQGGWAFENGTFVFPESQLEQIDQAWRNVDKALKTAGGKGSEQVFRVNSYHTSITPEVGQRMKENFERWIPHHKPIWTQIGVKELGAPGMDYSRARNGPPLDRNRPYRRSPPLYDRDRDRDRRQESDSWRPGDRDRRDLPPRPPPRDNYREATDSYRPRMPQGDFTFRVDKPAGIPDFPVHYGGPSDRRGPRRDGRGRGRGRGGRRWQPPPHPSERALVSGAAANMPEERLGEEGAAKFRDVEQLSDDDELEMDISSSSETEGPSKKRTKTADDTASGDAAPKWSNPDPYTALPCPDETTRKKKDVVKLIRKARVEDQSDKLAASTEAEDFISFDLTEDDETSEEEDA
ncbi:hypothetical protein F66182_5361, partial [Fusarium sp. NRRL 66182]